MNQLQVLRLSFQCIFVINCILLYGYLMRNNLEQTIAIRARASKMVENTCYSSNRSKTNNKIDDILSMKTPIFDRHYRNPCFYEVCNSMGNVTKQLKCLPYFHVLGVDKCGSTDLFLRLLQHPSILGNNGSLNKETMWWSWKRYGLWLSKYKVKRELFSDYLGYFDSAAVNISNTITNDSIGVSGWHPLVTGDGTPMDFWDFTGWRNIQQNKGLDHPKVLTPHLIHHINPNVKLIIIIRNPTQRLYSDFMFLKLGLRTSKGFHDAVGFSTSYLKFCMKNRTIESCVYDRQYISMYKARLHVGLYSVYLKEWLKVFNKDQILVLRTEDYSANIKETLKTVFNFLQLEELQDKDLDRIAKISKAYKTKLKKKQGPMHKKTKDILDKFYRPYNEELARLLNDSRFLWKLN